MHTNSMTLMNRFVQTLDRNQPLRVLDVGSYDVNGNYRNLFQNPWVKWQYQGLDLEAGPNVDIVETNPYQWGWVQDQSYDVVVSGQCMEHVEAPWLWVREVERVCKLGGRVCIIVPAQCVIHRYPVDCWRVLPDGMKYLLEQWCCFEIQECDVVQVDAGYMDCYAFATRKYLTHDEKPKDIFQPPVDRKKWFNY